jgi:hypothetical protein
MSASKAIRWKKGGLVYAPDGTRWWARRNASFPAVCLQDDVLRVFFTALDDRRFGRTGYVDLDPEDPSRVVRESAEPVLDLGEVGAFDDCGANAFCALRVGDATYLYYQGWQRAERVPYLIFTGLAIDDGDGQGFRRYSRAPLLDRTDEQPFLRGAPCVVRLSDGFHMWYVSSRRWVHDAHGLHYEVAIHHARSPDGVDWTADERPCVEPDWNDEYAVGRPSVLVEGNTYRMWYSVRSFSQPYRLGYAESGDGHAWMRRDSEVGLERSDQGWDSQMTCYPQVIRVDGRLLMFYNGNGHGASGFGYAEGME